MNTLGRRPLGRRPTNDRTFGRRRFVTAVALAAGLAALVPSARAEDAKDFPSRAVHVIVPFTPGSSADSASRFLGTELSEMLGQPFVVENRPGGAGAIAISAVKGAPADGYTILLASNSLLSVNPLILKSLPDPANGLKPLSGISRGVNALVVAADSPYKTLGDLVAAGKAKGAEGLNGGTYSGGYRLAAEWLAALAGFKFNNIAYKGASQLLIDATANRLDFAVVSLDGAMPMVEAGKLRMLAISDEKRHEAIANVPTIKESFPEYVNYSWDSFYVRDETPQAIADKLTDALQKALAMEATKDFIVKAGRQPMPYKPAQMEQYQKNELERFRAIANAAGIKPE